MIDVTQGHYCKTARAITPIHEGYCEWCGENPQPRYEWYVPYLGSEPPYWRSID